MTQPEQGIPRNPRGWLYHVALRRLTDQVRSEMARRRREEAVAGELWAEWAFVPPLEADVSLDQDDSLALLFMCCHPSLTPPSAIALTLRAVGGLATAEIARAFLVPEATMAQRISRAKQSIRSSGIAFSLPDEVERAARLDQVLQVLYLIFNEGYTTWEGPRSTAWTYPARPSGSAGCCTRCCPGTGRSRDCWRSCCCPMPVGRRARGRRVS